ncbi:MAG: hypothetical protein ACXVEF_30870 [Polyangiales bacterium]
MRGEVQGDTVKLSPSGDVESMRVREETDALVVELLVRRATVADVEEATGPTQPGAGGRRSATKVFWDHDVRFELDEEPSGVTKVAIQIPLDQGN